MKYLLIILLLFTLQVNAQHEVRLITGTDTVWSKPNTDSLYKRVNGSFIFFSRIRNIPPAYAVGVAESLGVKVDKIQGKGLSTEDYTTAEKTKLEGLSNGSSPIVILTDDVTNNNGSANTLADVTGLSFPVTAGTTYKFRFVIFYTSAATTTGSRWSINGPANTLLRYRSSYTLTATSRTFNEGLTGYNVPAASSASSVVASNMAVIEGIITPSANGSVIARFASEVSNSAIVAKAKSYVEYQSY